MIIKVGKEQMFDSDEEISKRNRRKKLEAERNAEVVHLPVLNIDREISRKVRDKRLNLLVKKARKKG